MKKIILFLEKYNLSILISLSIAISIIATTYYLNNNQIVSYNDAKSHLNIARRVVDSKTPGIVQLGGTWLPLPQLLIIPFVWNDYLWQSGLAGSIVSMISYILSVIIIYKISVLLTKNNVAATSASLIFMFNRNVLYLQSTPMTELLLIVTMLAAIFYFIKWLDQKKLVDLINSAFMIFLSTLSRYDGWFLFIVACFILLLESLYFYKSKRKSEGNLIIFGFLGSLGILLWISWNTIIWHRPLYFLSGEHSARHQQAQIEAAGGLLTKHNLYLSTKTVVEMTYMNSGILFAVLFIFILFYILFKNYSNRKFLFALLLLSSPILFNLVSLYLGISTIDTTLESMFNIRYGVMGIPLVSVIIGMGAIYLNKVIKYFYLLIIIGLLFYPYRIVTLYDPLYSSSGTKPYVTKMEYIFKSEYKGGDILASVFAFDPSMHVFGIPFKRYIHEGNYRIWDIAISKPEKYVDWVMMSKNEENDVLYRYYVKNITKYSKYYNVFYNEDNYLILKKI